MKVPATEAKCHSGSQSTPAEQLPNVDDLAARREWFNETYKEWIAAQNRFFEEYGVFGEEFRPW